MTRLATSTFWPTKVFSILQIEIIDVVVSQVIWEVIDVTWMFSSAFLKFRVCKDVG